MAKKKVKKTKKTLIVAAPETPAYLDVSNIGKGGDGKKARLLLRQATKLRFEIRDRETELKQEIEDLKDAVSGKTRAAMILLGSEKLEFDGVKFAIQAYNQTTYSKTALTQAMLDLNMKPARITAVLKAAGKTASGDYVRVTLPKGEEE